MGFDYRFFTKEKRDWYYGINNSQTKVLIDPEKYYDHCEDEEQECLIDRLTKKDGYIHLPFNFEVCSSCGGTGSYVDPNIDSNGITSEEFENDWSYEDRENYFSGMYNITCEECNGARVVPEIEFDYLTQDEKKFVKLLDEIRNDAYEEARQDWKERQMGY